MLRPIVNLVAVRGVNANQVMLSALALSFVTGLLIALLPEWPQALLLIPFILFIRMALDAI